MSNGKLFVATIFSVMQMTGTAISQSSNASINGTNGFQIVFAAPNLANRQSVQDLVDELAAAGFTYIEIQRTFLGRAHFVAYSLTEKREVVLNAATGEILRDLIQINTENAPNGNGNNGYSGNGNNGNSGNGNNGNSGGGNNGNGNGNSGN